MILDKKFNGILDQGTDCLISFESDPKNVSVGCEPFLTSPPLFDLDATVMRHSRAAQACYSSTLDTISSMSLVVDALFQRAAKLT